MQKMYCDQCKQEIKQDGRTFDAGDGQLIFSVEAGVGEISKGDVCLPCVIKAINKEASKVLKRKYTKKQKEETSGTTASNPSDS